MGRPVLFHSFHTFLTQVVLSNFAFLLAIALAIVHALALVIVLELTNLLKLSFSLWSP